MKRKNKSLGMAPVARGGTQYGYSESPADSVMLGPRGPLGPASEPNIGGGAAPSNAY